MDKDNFLKLLSLAFDKEYNDVFLYLKEAEMFREKIVEGESIGKIFEHFSLMELRHADILASKIIGFGAKAKWVFMPLEKSGSLRDVLQRHVLNETNAVRLFDEILENCSDVDFKITLKGIREDEKEHLEKVSHILKHLKSE
jgi:rubrerythrin